MGRVKTPEPVLLFAGIIGREEKLLKLEDILSPLGMLEDRSEILSFDEFSRYYEKEMGPNLKRLWISFQGVRSPENLHMVKVISNRIEEEHAEKGLRTINIDPGYVSLSNVILFTTKNYYHRIYIGSGIYSEVTLYYNNPVGFTPLPWTYPDYKSKVALEFFNSQRKKLYMLRKRREII
ncbi:MAG TPA: DUF4416 family protein [Candidatus Hydrothermia bacterium]|nr:DUF4416 family protein [Candidatus Hydrothermae bacterium]MDD3649050.1 DUF4416 family protein [Candidatus Hydrothermia bacterium]MDD5573005.1 DUF4416 family protein [Candidatus Hydrothermia bacterium]HOK22989.1 DUF4416 family protein [Candidatus Hydrothermia bacterium]HOL23751.1 DUF4416 family protein [Candidatus Hydrothermia bacterium]